MNQNIIQFKDRIHPETIFFFGVSEKDGKRNHIRTVANRYSLDLRGKYVLVDSKISKKLADFCYLKVNRAIKKDFCFVVTDATPISSQKATKEELDGIDLVSRPHSVKRETVKYFNAKSKLGNIDSVLVTYEINGHQGIFYDNYLFLDGEFITVIDPCHHYEDGLNQSNIDYSKVLYKDFERIK